MAPAPHFYHNTYFDWLVPPPYTHTLSFQRPNRVHYSAPIAPLFSANLRGDRGAHVTPVGPAVRTAVKRDVIAHHRLRRAGSVFHRSDDAYVFAAAFLVDQRGVVVSFRVATVFRCSPWR